MGRQPKTRSIDLASQLYVLALGRTGKSDLPSEPYFLGGIVNALLERMAKRSISEAHLVRTFIRIVAGLEKLDGLPVLVRDSLAWPCLIEIAFARPSKVEHYSTIVQLQWTTLLSYLKEHDLGAVRSLPTSSQLEHIVKMLSVLPCKCRYRNNLQSALLSLEQWVNKRRSSGKKSIEDLAAHLAYHLLAALHRTGHEDIRKLLSRYTQTRKSPIDILTWVKAKKRPGGALDRLSTTHKASLPIQESVYNAALEYVNRSASRPG